MQYYITPEIFEIPDGREALLYAPLLGVICRVDSDIINNLIDIDEGICPPEIFELPEIIQLIDSGVITQKKEKYVPWEPGRRSLLEEPFLPTDVTIFLSCDCNLACKYCYGDGGERKTSISADIAFAAIDLVFDNAKKVKSNQVHVNYHGGGEPTLAIELMEELTAYTRKRGKEENFETHLGLTTNGVWSEKVFSWIVDNIDNLNISFDGTEAIQNFQRPLRDGGASYPHLEKTLKGLDAAEKEYCLRGTITQYSQNHIAEIAQFICDNFRPKIIQLEPMFESQRASRTTSLAPESQLFINGMMQAEEICRKAQVELKFSGLRFPQMSNVFCSIGRSNFAVTAEGNVTACFEVLQPDDHRSEIFFYGSYNGKSFTFDSSKIEYLRDISELIPKACKECFVKFHCSGDCRGKGYYSSIDHSQYQGAGRCDIIRGLIKNKLIKVLADQGRGETHVGK